MLSCIFFYNLAKYAISIIINEGKTYHSSKTAQLGSQQASILIVLFLSTVIENLPEAKRLICGRSANGGVVRCHRHVKDPLGVAAQVCDFRAGWVFP